MEQRIAFVTCAESPAMHGDDRLVADALQRCGFRVTPAVWNDPCVDWRPFASVVIRAAWDYHLDAPRYAAWLRRCETEAVNLWNPAPMVLSNIDKGYLSEFAPRPTRGCSRSRDPSPVIVEGARRVLAQAAPPLYAVWTGSSVTARSSSWSWRSTNRFLYIGSSDGAAKRFAAAIARTTARPRSS